MPLICVCSPKGGVGKTTLTANLAYALARSGSKVLALDFDVQNALRLHFGVPLSDERGYVAKSAESSDWSQFVLTAGGNIFVLPYGEASEDQRLVFEERLTNDEHFLIRGLNTLLNYPGLIIGRFSSRSLCCIESHVAPGRSASGHHAGRYRLSFPVASR